MNVKRATPWRLLVKNFVVLAKSLVFSRPKRCVLWPSPLSFPWRWLELETGANKLEFDKLLSSLKSRYRESFEAPHVELTFVISWKGWRLIVGSSFSRLILRKSINSGSGLMSGSELHKSVIFTCMILGENMINFISN